MSDTIYVLCVGSAGCLPDDTEVWSSKYDAETAADLINAGLNDGSPHNLYSAWVEEWDREEWENSDE